MTATLLILAAAIVAFVSGRVPLSVVAVGVAVSLWATGVLDLQQALAGFGDPVVLFIASLFVDSEALEATGVTSWAGSQVTRRAGTGRVAVLVVISLLVAVVTAFISVNGAVAALIPMVVVVATRSGIPASQLLMPLAFAAHAGSQLALTGTQELDSDIADIKNMGGPNGGSIHAALFLEEFVDGTPWAHLDIAGTAQASEAGSWTNKGPTAFGVRLLVELALALRRPDRA